MTQSVDQASTVVVPDWTLADRMRKARLHAGLEQTEIAADLGISRQSVGNYENGRTKPLRVVLMAWAMRTGVPLAWLRDGVMSQPSPDDGGPTAPYPHSAGAVCELTHSYVAAVQARQHAVQSTGMAA